MQYPPDTHRPCSDILIAKLVHFVLDDYDHSMGCYADVLTYFDGQCSGRSGCKVVIGSLDAVAQPCPKDFKSYLEASYVCIKGNCS